LIRSTVTVLIMYAKKAMNPSEPSVNFNTKYCFTTEYVKRSVPDKENQL
jgi:hypothetical protein